jgi:putative membrane protein
MSKKWKRRPPAVFRLDQGHLIVDSAAKTGGSSERRAQITSEPEFEALAMTVDDSTRSSRRGVRWAMLFWGALGGLLLLAIGIAVSDLITNLLARNQELGWLGLAFAILAMVSLLVIAVREATGLMRLATVEKLRQRAAEMIVSDDRIEGRTLVHELLDLTRKMPHLARGRADLEGHLGEIIDGSDMVRLAERELMTPLDQQARKLISMAATRVAVVTAVSPRAVVDILFVFGTALTLVRRLAFLYGARPGTLSLARLLRQVVMHLAVTGGLAASDSLIQQMLGHGIAAKLSARFGEGVLNGLLTARFGLAAVDLIRPVPFAALPRPTLSDLMSEVFRSFGEAEERQGSESSLALTEVQ